MRTEEVIYKAGFALGLLSLLVFSLGHLGFLSPGYLALALLISIISFVVLLKKDFASAKEDSPAHEGHKPLLLWEKLLILSIAALTLSAVPLALMPPSIRDEIIQHLAVPKLYLARGAIFQIPFMGFSYLPQNIDLLYVIPLAFGSDVAARVMHLLFAVLTGLVIYCYLSPREGRVYALLGMLLYISTPLVFNLSRMAYIDNGSAFYSTLALVAALNWKESGSTKWLVYSAVSMGFALGSKYNNAISFVLIGAFVFYIAERRSGRLVEGLKAGLVFALIAFAVFSPWLVRNYVWKGSPFYPIYESAAKASSRGEGVHVTGDMSPVAKRYMVYGESTSRILLLPFRIFLEGKDNSIEKFDGVLNPVFLLFIPLAFIGRRHDDRSYLLAFFCLFFLMAAFTVDLVTRYLLPSIPALIILVTLGIKNLFEGKNYLRLINTVLLTLLFFFNAVYIASLYGQVSPLPYLEGRESRDAYLSRTIPDYDSIRFANSYLPAGAKVMLVFAGDRGYYWKREYYYGDRAGIYLKGFVNGSRDDEELKKKFSSLGVTHLFANDRLLEKFANDNFDAEKIALLAAFFKNHVARLYASNGFSVYVIK